MKDRKMRFWYFGVIFFLAVIYLAFEGTKRASLYKNGIIIPGLIHEVNHGAPKGGSIVISYSFTYKEKRYSGGVDSGLPYRIKSKIINKHLPVLVDTTKPTNNRLMLSRSTWKGINLNRPDSLNWLNDF